VKRLTNVVGIFPIEDAIQRLFGAGLIEQNDEWAVSRRYMSLETLAGLSDNPPVSARPLPPSDARATVARLMTALLHRNLGHFRIQRNERRR
jgi:hypothetical protein